jgi:hypothetical protein
VHLSARPKPTVRVFSLEPLRGHLAVVLTDLAQEGNDAAEVPRAFAAGWTSLGLTDEPPIQAWDRLDAAVLDRALAQLDRADDGLKRRIVAACAACIAADGTVTAREAELLRLVADCLGSPLPPFVADASWAS